MKTKKDEKNTASFSLFTIADNDTDLKELYSHLSAEYKINVVPREEYVRSGIDDEWRETAQFIAHFCLRKYPDKDDYSDLDPEAELQILYGFKSPQQSPEEWLANHSGYQDMDAEQHLILHDLGVLGCRIWGREDI